MEALTSGPRRYERYAKKTTKSSFSMRKSDHVPGTRAICEADTAADTCCSGINHRPISFTGQTCEVQGFHDDMSAIKDIPVATTATAYTDQETG